MKSDTEAEIIKTTGITEAAWTKHKKNDSTIAIELGEKRRMTSVVPSNLVANWETQFRDLATQAMKARAPS